MSTHWLVKDKADGTYLGTDGGWGKRDEALKYADERQAFEAADKRYGFGDSQPTVMRVTRRSVQWVVTRSPLVGTSTSHVEYLIGFGDSGWSWGGSAYEPVKFDSRQEAKRAIANVSRRSWFKLSVVKARRVVKEGSGER